jgi:hypothetical protein
MCDLIETAGSSSAIENSGYCTADPVECLDMDHAHGSRWACNESSIMTLEPVRTIPCALPLKESIVHYTLTPTYCMCRIYQRT